MANVNTKTKSVEEIVREVCILDLEDSIDISDETTMASLDIEPIDVLEIFFELGIPYIEYSSGEEITDKGRVRLKDFQNYMAGRVSGERYKHLGELAELRKSDEFMKKLTIRDLKDMKEYEMGLQNGTK